MKKHLFILWGMLITSIAFSQTLSLSFECQPKSNLQGFTQSQIETYIAKANLESFRLKASRMTLSFDNGFDIVLLSATELEHIGLIHNSSGYPLALSPDFKLPKFHLNDAGIVCTEYAIANSKYSEGKK
jgi:hypothetical protein